MLKIYKILLFSFFIPYGLKPAVINKEVEKEQQNVKNTELNIKKLKNSVLFFSKKNYIENKLLELINREKSDIKIIAYSFNNMKIKDALIEAAKKNIKIEIIIDTKDAKKNSSIIESLKSAHIEIKPILSTFFLGNNYSGMMHEKVMIFGYNSKKSIDSNKEKAILVTGSYNLTDHANKNLENLIIQKSNSDDNKKTITSYLKNFDRIKNLKTPINKTNRKTYTANIKLPKNLFSDKHDIETYIIGLIRNETKSINIVVYTLTNEEIIKELIIKNNASVLVNLFSDESQLNNFYMFAAYKLLENNNIKINFISGMLTHHKFLIFEANSLNDQKSILANGSYNLTAASNNQNLENMSIITEKPIIDKFKEEFNKLDKAKAKKDFIEANKVLCPKCKVPIKINKDENNLEISIKCQGKCYINKNI